MRELTVGPDGKTRVMQERLSLIVVERYCTYIYCIDCGNLKMLHIHAELDPSAAQVEHALKRMPMCVCSYRHDNVENARNPGGVTQARMELLADIHRAFKSGIYTGDDEKLRYIEHLASQEEMRA